MYGELTRTERNQKEMMKSLVRKRGEVPVKSIKSDINKEYKYPPSVKLLKRWAKKSKDITIEEKDYGLVCKHLGNVEKAVDG